MLPSLTPRLRIALATAAEIVKHEQRREVTCFDIMRGITSLTGGVADSLLKARGFSSPIPAFPKDGIYREATAFAAESLQAISAAMQASANRSNEIIGIEDMLLGILSSPSAEVSRLFAEKNLNVEELISELRKQM